MDKAGPIRHVRRPVAGRSFYLQTRGAKVMVKLARLKVMRELGKANIHLSKRDAIEEIVPALNNDICGSCTKRIFLECAGRPNVEMSSAELAEGNENAYAGAL